jgi:hypothetical protein
MTDIRILKSFVVGSDMRVFYFSMVAGLIALCAAWLCVIPLLEPSFELEWINGIYEKKESSAAAIKQNKLLIIGGSASHFSYSAEIIGAQTGIPTVNLATHAGLTVSYLLYRARRSLKPGDTALVNLEVPLVPYEAPTRLLTQFVAYFDRSYLLRAGMAIPQFVFGANPSDVLLFQFFHALPWAGPQYLAETVDRYGDKTVATPSIVTPFMRANVRASPPVPVWNVNPVAPPNSLRDFAEWARANNIRLLQGWPPTVERPEYLQATHQEFFNRMMTLYQNLGFKTVGTQQDFLLRDDETLDTNFHAIIPGRDRISLILAVKLCEVTDCPKGAK